VIIMSATPPKAPEFVSADKIGEFVEVVLTKQIPDMTEALKSQIKIELENNFSAGKDGVKKIEKNALDHLNSKEQEILAELKKQLKEAQEEIASGKKSGLQAISDNLTDWATAMKFDPKLADIFKGLPVYVTEIKGGIEEAKKIFENIKNLKKTNRQVPIDYVKLIVGIISTAVVMMSIISYLLTIIAQIRGG
jgi:hypothetical protein